MTTKSTERRIALFLDFENLVTNTGLSANHLDLQSALDRLLEQGKIVYRRAYADWSRFREGKGHLHSMGIDLIDVPPSTRSGKNGADMRLVIDALELCYAREHINTFVIASGDSDFVPLAAKLRENDRIVIGLGVKGSTSPLFVRACDEFIYLRPGGGTKVHEEGESPVREERSGRGGRGGDKDKKHKDDKKKGDKAEKGEKAEKKGQVPGFVRDVVTRLLSRATGPVNPSLIKETLVRRTPDFDERDYGFSTLTKLLGALEKEGVLKLQQLKGKQWYVVPGESLHEASRHDNDPIEGASSPDLAAVTAHEDEDEVYPDPED